MSLRALILLYACAAALQVAVAGSCAGSWPAPHATAQSPIAALDVPASAARPSAALSADESDLERHLASVRPLLERYGYGAVFGAIFLEGFGIPAPGQTLLIAAALLAADGELSLVALLALAFVASAGGTLLGWGIGRFGGRRLLERVAGPRLDRLEATCRRRGGVLVAFGRFVDGARQLAGIAAGALGMPLAPFLWWNLVGAVTWVGVWGIGSFVLERNAHTLIDAYRRIGPMAAIAILALAAAVLLWLVRGRRAAAS